MQYIQICAELKEILDEGLQRNIRMVIGLGECKSHTQSFFLEKDVLIHTIQHSRQRKVYHLGREYPSCRFDAVCIERKPNVLWKVEVKYDR